MLSPKLAFREVVLSGVLIGGAMDLIEFKRMLTVGIKHVSVDQHGNFHILPSWTGEIKSGILQESDIYIAYARINANTIVSAEKSGGDRWKLKLGDSSHLFFQPPYKGQALTIQAIRGTD